MRSIGVLLSILLVMTGARCRGQEAPVSTHWALQTIRRPLVPGGPSSDGHPLDAFVRLRLKGKGLRQSGMAGRRTLIRRVSLDLTGLPPSPERVDAFVADERPDAYDLLVDELLASLRYGERMARHWLDVVGFAETNGFETNTPRPRAWPYRDWVIDAFNDDMPFPEFVRAQLAGDVTGQDAATGFLVAGPADQVASKILSAQLEQRDSELHDMVSRASSTFLGFTVGCAKCHDHKFDPISQRDYYAMRAVFTAVRHGERELLADDPAARKREIAALDERLGDLRQRLDAFVPFARDGAPPAGGPLRPAASPRRNVDRFAPVVARRVRFVVRATNNGSEPCVDELEVWAGDENVALAATGTAATTSGVYVGNPKHKLEHINDGRFGNSRSWISNEAGKGWVALDLPADVTIDRVVWGRDRDGVYSDRLPIDYTIEVAVAKGPWRVVASSVDRVPFGTPAARLAGLNVVASAATTDEERRELAALEDEISTLEERRVRLARKSLIYAGNFDARPQPAHMQHRGDPSSLGDVVVPAFPSCLGVPLHEGLDTDRKRRVALADAIVDPANPLTTRVIVNRVWAWHFGRGLVATPSDFGVMGAEPSHPDLLDWLASSFADGGQTFKALHRTIVRSGTYRQSSTPDPQAMVVDSASVFLWRFRPRRLEAEAIRDSILSVSGMLDLSMGGPGFNPFRANNNYVRVYSPKDSYGPADWRRMIYQTKVRMEQDPTFGAFDCPDGGLSCPSRTRSTTSLQAFNLFNSPFAMQQARFFAERVRHHAGAAPAAQVAGAFRYALARIPTAEEVEASTRVVRDHGLVALCRALLNTSEFVYLE